MALFQPFPLSYPVWIALFVLLPLIVLWTFHFSYFRKQVRIFALAVLGSIVFSFPWDYIAIKKQIWVFEEPYIFGFWFLGLPVEEWFLSFL